MLVFKRSLSSLAPIGPRALYQSLIDSNRILPNQDQFRSVIQLEKLCAKLLDYEPPLQALPHHPTRVGLHGLHPILPSSVAPEQTSIRPDTQSNQLLKLESLRESQKIRGPKGIWMHGSVGTGKTMLMDLFYQSVPVQRKTRIHFHAYMQSVYSKINHWNKLNKNAKARKEIHVLDLVARDLINDAWLYCFDEFQVTDIATAAIMRQLFTHLFDMGAVVVATSNRLPKNLYSAGFQQSSFKPFTDLLEDRVQILHLRSDRDYRELLLQESPLSSDHQKSYFLLDSAQDSQDFIQRVASLFYGKHLRKESFQIYKRHVFVPKAAQGMALYTFDELCGSGSNPMGAADYLKLCQLYHTIVIQSIPQMGLTEKNEARRFITFIDAAYENKVKIICSAEVEPGRLFVVSDILTQQDSDTSESFMHKEMMGDLLYEQEGIKVSGREKTASELMKLAIFTAEDEKFAFKRAVSRLKEMQSVSYWAQTHAPVPSEFAGLNSMNQPDVSSNNEEKGPTGSTVVSKGDDPLKDAPPRFTDDFGDEASYTGYLKQFQRFSPTSEPGRDPIMDTFKLKEDSKPKFKENHFWSVGDASSWGKKAGKWGEGVAALFSLDKKGRKGSGEGKGDQ